MKKMAKLLALLLAAALAAAFTAGCGPSGGAKDGDFKYLKSKNEIIIGYTVYAPMNYTDDQGTFTGFDTELSTIVSGKLGVKPKYVEIDWDTKEVELNAKSIDCIWNGLTITDDRKANMAITAPYIKNAQVVVMKSDAAYTDTGSLAGKTVCAEAGSAGAEAIEEDENLKKATYVAKEVQTACLLEVASGTADAAILDLTLAKAMTGDGTDYAGLAIKDRLATEYYGVAFRKDSDVCAKVNDIFAALKKDGTLKRLADKYGLDLSE